MRKTFKWKQLLSILVCLSMVCSLVIPSSVLADSVATVDNTVASNGVSLEYEKRIRDNSDGTYTLTIAAQTAVKHTAANTDSKVAKKGYYVVPEDGEYIVQVWGSDGADGTAIQGSLAFGSTAEGGNGGNGGYVEGVVTLTKGQVIAYDIGGKGYASSTSGVGGGANYGGNHGTDGTYPVAGGGGYTAVYVYDSANDITYDHKSNYVLIAGGGGGGGSGYSNQTQTPDGGNAGNMKTSASATLTEEQNGVAGTYYAGANGKTNSGDGRYAGKGATYLPGESNSSVWGWMKSNSGNDWLATYDTSRNGGAGGDANGRGGAGGAGFAGGGGGVQSSAINLLSSECGGGGGGSSFIADKVNTTIDEAYNSLMETENISTTGGSVVVIPMNKALLDTSALANATVSGEISEYFEIVAIDGEAYSGTTNSFEVAKDLTEGNNTSFSITVKPVDGFMGGNAVPVLKEETTVSVKAGGFSYSLAANEDTDYVNVPFKGSMTTYNVYTTPGAEVTAAQLYLDEGLSSKINESGYEFISAISGYAVKDADGNDVYTPLTAPDTTTKYTVSYSVTAKEAAAKVGTPVVSTVSATAVVDVSGSSNAVVDGASEDYKKTLVYNADGTYDLIIEKKISPHNNTGYTVVEESYDVTRVTPDGNNQITVDEDAYYLILLHGGNGADGGDVDAHRIGTLTGTEGHSKASGGKGAAGSAFAILDYFNENSIISVAIGAESSKPTLAYETGPVSVTALGDGGAGGKATSVTLNGTSIAIAGGGGGGGGAAARKTVGVDDPSYAGGDATAYTGAITTTLDANYDGEDGGDAKNNFISIEAGSAGASAPSYVYDTSIITSEDTISSYGFEHGYAWSTGGLLETAINEKVNFNELTSSGVVVYKITHTEASKTEIEGVRENLALNGEISKYFKINKVTVEGSAADPTVTVNGNTFGVSGISTTTDEQIVTYTINLSPSDGFLGGNDVPVFATETYSTGLQFSRTTNVTDEGADTVDLVQNDASDYANVVIADYEFGLAGKDTTIVKGDSVNISELYTVNTLPTDWRADYVKLNVYVEGEEGEEGETVSPVIPTEYTVVAELAPKGACEKAVVAQPAESVKATAIANVDVEYSVKYNLTNIKASNEVNAKYLAEYTTVLSSDGYALPINITVVMGEKELSQGTDYSYDNKTGYIVINENVVTDNLTITASATEETYTITYNAYDKSGTLIETWSESYVNNAKISHEAEDEYAAKMNAVADGGYEYVWNWGTEDGSRLDIMPARDIAVYGYYDKIAYTLTINYVYENGDSAAGDFAAQCKWGENYEVVSPDVTNYTPDIPVVSGTMPMEDTTITVTYKQDVYPLIIAYVDEYGRTIAPTYSTSLAVGAEYTVDSPVIEGYTAYPLTVEGTMPAEAVNVTVTYTEDVTEVAVTFDANGGTLAEDEKSKTVLCGNNRTYGELPTPLYTGYKFLGWYTEKDGGILVESTTVVTEATAHTLYAQWEKISSAVTYYANGGQFSDSSIEKTTAETAYGEAYPTVDDPSRTGYTFLGWYREVEAKNVFNTNTIFTFSSPTKLYAGWKANDAATVNFIEKDATVKTYTFDPQNGATYSDKFWTPTLTGGYFAGWCYDDTVYSFDYKDEAKKRNVYAFSLTDATSENEKFKADFVAKWYDSDAMGKANISNAKAQAVTLKDGRQAIRFLALIDADYADYQQAGFVISTECPTPTIEAGYQYSSQNTIYKKIYAMKADATTGWLDIAYLSENTFSFSNGAGLLYTNLVIKDGNEDKIYYATPYIINASGEYVYGETRAISYNQLKEYDASANSN